MANKKLTATYESLPWLAKILLEVFLGYFIAIGYRLIRFLENKKTINLIGALIALIPGPFWILDLVTEIISNRITILCD